MGIQIRYRVGSEPNIPVDIMDVNGNWKTVSMLADTGNQETFISYFTALELGWDAMGDQTGYVQGVFGDPQPVGISEDIVMKIGQSMPFLTRVRSSNDPNMRMDLLGYDVLSKHFTTTYDGEYVILEQKDDCTTCFQPEESEFSL